MLPSVPHVSIGVAFLLNVLLWSEDWLVGTLVVELGIERLLVVDPQDFGLDVGSVQSISRTNGFAQGEFVQFFEIDVLLVNVGARGLCIFHAVDASIAIGWWQLLIMLHRLRIFLLIHRYVLKHLIIIKSCLGFLSWATIKLTLTWVGIWVDQLASSVFAFKVLRPHPLDIAIINWPLRQLRLLIQHKITLSFLFLLRVENPSVLHFMLRIHLHLHNLLLILMQCSWFQLFSHLNLLLLLSYPSLMRVFPIILVCIHLHEVVVNAFLNGFSLFIQSWSRFRFNGSKILLQTRFRREVLWWNDLNDVLFDIFTSNGDVANRKIFVIVRCPWQLPFFDMMRQPWRMLLSVLLKTFLLFINFTICSGSLLFPEDIVISIMDSIVILIVFYQVHDISFRFEFQFFFSFDCFLFLLLLNVTLFSI